MKELIENITRKLDSFRRDAESQLDKGNKSAGLRARRTSLELEPLLKQFRKLSLAADKTKTSKNETDSASTDCNPS